MFYQYGKYIAKVNDSDRLMLLKKPIIILYKAWVISYDDTVLFNFSITLKLGLSQGNFRISEGE